MNNKRQISARFKIIIGLVLLFIAGGGWFLGRLTALRYPSDISLRPLREDGYDFVNPVLVCSRDGVSVLDGGVEKVIQDIINTEIKNGNITTASVYYRNFLDNSWAILNGEEKYFPASLNKVPLMMAYYNWAEEAGFPVLETRLDLPLSFNENVPQEIQPKHSLQPGRSYTVNELLDAMIKDSDNNAALLLLKSTNKNILKGAFSDLHVPFLADEEKPTNYMSVADFAFFFRVLYNGTYISHSDSERALSTLSQTFFTDGLVAGVPTGTTVAHKFGLVSVAPDKKNVVERELHDCGVVYPARKSPYLLCVMTKSAGSLKGVEQAIANVSHGVYKYINK